MMSRKAKAGKRRQRPCPEISGSDRGDCDMLETLQPSVLEDKLHLRIALAERGHVELHTVVVLAGENVVPGNTIIDAPLEWINSLLIIFLRLCSLLVLVRRPVLSGF